MRRITGIAILAAAIGALLAGCSREGQQAKAEGQNLTIKGSDTMVHLVGTWAEEYMNAHPGAEISVTGGGSGTGIAALINGTTDIAASSRDIKQEERDQAAQTGVEPVEHVVARDGIAIVVNPRNPVTALTMEQVRKIYTSAVTNWNQVGGPDAQIIVLSRESSSGTYVFFQEHVLEKQDYAASVRLMPATSSIVQTAADDANAIGYVGLGYAAEAGDRIKVIPIKADAGSPAVVPSDATVNDGTYSIARPLYLYTKGAPTGIAKEFIDFATGPDGQRIVKETGYVAIR